MKVTARNIYKLMMKAERKRLRDSLRLTKKQKALVRRIDAAIIDGVKKNYKNVEVDFLKLNALQKDIDKIIAFYRQKRGIGCTLVNISMPHLYRFILTSAVSSTC